MELNRETFKPVVILILVAIVISGIGFIVYRSQLNNAPAIESIESEIPDGFVQYQNQELGLSFFYPKEWGEVKYKKDTRNHPKEAEE